MRPLASHEARPEPTAIPTENTARSTVTTSSVASSRFFTSGGRIDSVTAPTSQNQDTMTPPRHSRAIGPEVAQQRAGRAQDVEVDAKIGRRLAGPRDEQARCPAQHREADHEPAEGGRIAAVPCRVAAGDGADEDRQEGRGLDEGVAGGQLRAAQMIRQDAVFDRAEQGRDDAEGKQRREQDRKRVQPEPDDGEAGGADLGKLQAPRQDGHVVAVGKLAADAGEEEERAR